MTAGGPALVRDLRRSERRAAWRAAALILPLFVFLLLTFLLPIADMLVRSVRDPELSAALPETAARLRSWDGVGLPAEEVWAALAGELPAAADARSLAPAAQRLNHDVAGFRGLLLRTARALPPGPVTDPKRTLIDIDGRWREAATWAAMRRAAGPLTDLYLLTALDLDRDAEGRITLAPPEEAIFVDVMLRTLWLAAVVTAACLVLGYPLAYLLATTAPRMANLLMIMVLLPFWTSLVVRTSAWIVLLQSQGIVNDLLIAVGIVEAPLAMMFNRVGVVVAMSHVLLPFMVLPLYSVMRGIPPATMRAAASLGAPPRTAFLRVYLPQSLPGVASGTLLVFILALGYYVTPALVGGVDDQMLSYYIAFYTGRTVNWGLAAALAAALLVATGALYAVYARLAGAGGLRLG